MMESDAGHSTLSAYDKEKYKEMTLDAAETVLGFFSGLSMEIPRRIMAGKGNGDGIRN